MDDICLNIGCGLKTLDGFINIDKYVKGDDIVNVDGLNYLNNLDDGTVGLIYLSHFLEHVVDPYEYILECRRVLKKGGKIKIIVPNQSNRCVDHRTNSINVDYFNLFKRDFDIEVSVGWKFRFLTMVIRNFKCCRDWVFRRLFDEYEFEMLKK